MTKKKQKKKWRDSFDKYERDLENQKGNLTESLTNHRLSSYCRLVKQLVTKYFCIQKSDKTSNYRIILICLKFANARLKQILDILYSRSSVLQTDLSIRLTEPVFFGCAALFPATKVILM